MSKRKPMSRDRARELVGCQPRECLKAMALALCLHSYRNTADDWQRLEAAVVLLGRGAPALAKFVALCRRELHPA